MNVGIVDAGIFGLAAALELRSRGQNVTVFEQGRVPYEKASSTDVSKVIRRNGYGASETYLELVRRAADQWNVWQEQLGEAIYFQTGKLVVYRNFRPGTRGYDSWSFLGDWGPPIELLRAQEARARFPDITGLRGRHQGGDACCPRRGERLDEGQIVFDRAIIAAGPWMGRLVPQPERGLRVSRHHIALVKPEEPSMFAQGRMPIWSINEDLVTGEPGWEVGWYGFPLMAGGIVKVCSAEPGEVVTRTPNDGPARSSSSPCGIVWPVGFRHWRKGRWSRVIHVCTRRRRIGIL